MDRLKTRRRPFRTQLTKVINECDAELQKDNPDQNELLIKRDRIQQLYQSLEDLDKEIMDQMADDGVTEDEQNKEFEDIDKYVMSYLRIKSRIEAIYNVMPRVPSPTPSNVPTEASVYSTAGGFQVQKRVKLPKIELQKFNGDLKNWLGFWTSFQKIREDADLDEADKFHYLRQSMEPGSKAQEVIAVYPPTAENYGYAIDTLKTWFGNEDTLLQVYVREILQLVIANANTKEKMSFKSLYLQLDTHLKALKTLKLEAADPSTWLFPLVESSLPSEILLSWQRSPLSEIEEKVEGGAQPENGSRLEKLMKFIRKEVEIQDKMAIVQNGFQTADDGEKKKGAHKKASTVPSLAGLHVADTLCVFCEKGHQSSECFKARKMSVEDKKKILIDKKVCFSCLKVGHSARRCKANVMCFRCNKKHHTVMCDENNTALQSPKQSGQRTQQQQEMKPEDSHQWSASWPQGSNSNSTQQFRNNQATRESRSNTGPSEAMGGHAGFECSKEVTLKTVLVNILVNNQRRVARLFFDGGNQRSYILKRTAEELGLSSHDAVRVCHLLFKGKKTAVEKHHKYFVRLERYGGGFSFEAEVRDTDVICAQIPRVKKDATLMDDLKRNRIYYNDLGDDAPVIDILIGADYEGILLTGKVVQMTCGLTACETKLGWVLSGERNDSPRENLVNLMVMSMTGSDASIQDMWSLENLGIQDDTDRLTVQETQNAAKENLIRSITRNQDGRYCVKLPFMDDHPPLPSNKEVAVKRLERTTKKLVETEQFEKYDALLKEWENTQGFIEEVDAIALEKPCHYIPHRPVFKESLTTPVRPVFDCSCKIGKSPSLNDILHKGNNYIHLIPELLIRFREKKIAVTSDIGKAFQMIEVNVDDRDFLRFLWWEDNERKIIKVLRHVRLLFGATCSPFVLGAVLEYHLSNVTDEDKAAGLKLLLGFYVDNYVGSEDTEEEYYQFRQKTTSLLADARMDLRMWMSNCDKTFDPETLVMSILGMKWNRKEDVLYVPVSQIERSMIVTKRTLLSTVQKVFDPLGVLSPALIPMKMILQSAWINKMKWEDPLPEDEANQFFNWFNEIQLLEEIKIQRLATLGETDKQKWSLHTFTDASSYGYGCSCFLRVENEDGVSVQLLMAKARVAPLKKVTIPRLELLGCLIGARLANSVNKAINVERRNQYFWSDSTTALSWINREYNQEVFVRNRVKEITEKIDKENWRHVPGPMNPADLPSRGCSPKELLLSKWWEGPSWLYESESTWPPRLAIEDKHEEEKVIGACVVDGVKRDHTYCSSVRIMVLIMMMRIMILRFISNLKKGKGRGQLGHILSYEEVKHAEVVFLREIQKSALDLTAYKNLDPFVDENGLVRVKTRLTYREDLSGFKTPILLPKNHPITRKIIMETHRKNCHAGVNFLLANIRESFWIPQFRKTIKQALHSCFRCRRYSAKPSVVVEAPLPADRVRNATPFEITGVDLAGPLLLRNGKKVWIVIYTCAVFRAVHLDVVLSLSTQSFMKSLKVFVEKHGRPSVINSDNGTNFVGASKFLSQVDSEDLNINGFTKPIKWRFNPPSAAWWGGYWERLIRTVKDVLCKTLGKAVVNLEELRSVLKAVGEVMNNRPLTYTSESPQDLDPLTPAMFLRTPINTDFPVMTSDSLRVRHKHVQSLKNELLRRFRSEYLGMILSKGRNTSRPLQVGEIVFIGSDGQKRMEWKLGRILELFPGKDGVSRVARLKVEGGELTRPVQRLYPLELEHNEECPVSRYGRKLKIPRRYSNEN